MRILLTGATGFIGSHVVPRLLRAGHRVRALARVSSDVSRLPPEVEVVRGELGASPSACDSMEGLVHLAGISGALLRRGDPGRELRRVNVEATADLFAQARAAGVRRGVLVTSMWSMLRPDLAAVSPYVASRMDAERAVLQAGGSLEAVVLCPSFVVGSGDRGPNFPGAIVRALARGRLPIVAPGGSTWIAAADVAAAVAAALERGRPGTRYLLGSEYQSYRDLGAAVAAMTGGRAPLATAPWRAVELGSILLDRALGLLGRRAPIPFRFGTELLCQREAADCSEAHRDLGDPQVRVIDAVREAVAWFRAQDMR